MKIKLFICFLIWPFSSAFAQDFSVIGPQVQVEVEGTVYSAQSTGRYLLINNASNTLDRVPLVWNDGTQITAEEYSDLDLGELDLVSIQKVICETFSKEEFKQMKEEDVFIRIFMQVNSTGKVIEVGCFIKLTPCTLNLFPARIKRFEEQLKQHLKFSVGKDSHRLPSWRCFYPLYFKPLDILYLDKAPRDQYFEGEAIE